MDNLPHPNLCVTLGLLEKTKNKSKCNEQYWPSQKAQSLRGNNCFYPKTPTNQKGKNPCLLES